VAYHSGARYVAGELGLLAALDRYPEERSPVSDVLTYADQTIGPNGERSTPAARMAEMLHRHGPDSVNARVQPARGPYLYTIVDRVQARLLAAQPH
jgi:hypothetical protein